jgi:3',5'-cyclic AMP phosphodiesterase CpdA
MARLLALSDLHLDRKPNLDAARALPAFPDDWLLVAGDVADSPLGLALAWELLVPRFARVLWTPGNHELWAREEPHGEDRYALLVELCRRFGVLTPEDPPARFDGDGGPAWVVPLFTLYDFSFGPAGLDPAGVRAWAAEAGIRAADDRLLRPHPFPDIAAWCAHRHAIAEARLAAVPRDAPWVLMTHYPLLRELVRIYRVPRYTPWCGTRATAAWIQRYPVSVSVSGHLHMPATDWRSGVRFEEVSLGYPREWGGDGPLADRLRVVLPGPAAPWPGDGGPIWRR